MIVRPAGRRAALLEVADPPGVANAIRRRAAGLVVDVVPGATTVLVTVGRARDLPAVLEAAAGPPEPVPEAEPEVVHLEVRYDGADLETVGALSGLTPAGVIAAHSSASYRAAFSGFAPGFCYLEGLPEVLRLPRLPEPRPVVPAGAVAVADRYSAVYPRSSPGGWHLLGRSDARLWDAGRTPPALIRPGARVVFHPVP